MGLLSFIQSQAVAGDEPGRKIWKTERRVLGLPIVDLPWPELLAKAEAMVSRKGVRSEISFLDARTLVRQLFHPEFRDWLSQQVLLPSRRGVAGLVAHLCGVRTRAAVSAESFVPALLTYCEQPLRILLIGDSAPQLRALQDHLQAHTPWHGLFASSFDALRDGQAADLVVVLKGRPSISDRMRLVGIPAGLVIFAGPQLNRLVQRAEAPPAQPTVLSTPRSSSSRAA